MILQATEPLQFMTDVHFHILNTTCMPNIRFNMFLTLSKIKWNSRFYLLQPNFRSARYAKFIEVIITMVEISKLENVKYLYCVIPISLR